MTSIQIPFEAFLNIYLSEGVVILFEEDSYNAGHPHYFVLLNKIVTENTDLVLVNATSSKLHRFSGYIKTGYYMRETIVYRDDTNCTFLTKKSVFNCNSPNVKSPQELYLLFQSNRVRLIDETVESSLLEALRRGVSKSPQVSTSIKSLLSS